MNSGDPQGGMQDDNSLSVRSLEAFEALPDPAAMTGIVELNLGARLFRAIPFPELRAWIARFPSLAAIRLADDWIPDTEMPDVEKAFATAFPDKRFTWTYDALAGGKHGR